MITIAQLLGVMPEAGTRLEAYLGPLNDAMTEFSIDRTMRREAAFIAQVAEETEELRFMRELADGDAYEPPSQLAKELGNTEVGDGPKFKGGGGLMATGRWIYTRLASVLGLDLVNHPELIEQPAPAMRSAAWIWTVLKNLNGYADSEAFFTITHHINGGYTGGDSRLAYYLRARKELGL